MSPKRAPNLRSSNISREKWDMMLAAYRQRPTIPSVMEAGKVGKRTARRAIMEGWPDLGLLPFVELMTGGTSVHKEMAIRRESWQESAIVQGEAARQAAEEVAASKICQTAAMRAMELASTAANKLLERLNEGESPIPEEITLMDINRVLKALNTASEVAKRSFDIQRATIGNPGEQLGDTIGTLLRGCDNDELEIIIQTGHIPDRLLDHRAMTATRLSDEETEAEAAALAEDDIDIDGYDIDDGDDSNIDDIEAA